MVLFTPLVFSMSGDVCGETTVFNKRLAYLLSLKKEFRVVLWLCCHLSS